MQTIFTIGHSQHPVEYFVKLLKDHNINYLIDVRSMPYSEYAQSYNKENLQESLKKHSIKYFFMGTYFGARQENRDFYNTEGYFDYEKIANTDRFKQAVENVKKGMEQYNIALMCTEKEPIDCHRAVLVGNAFHNASCNVEHILADGKLINHEELNTKILNLYFANREQGDFFDNRTLDIYLRDAYRLRNKDIGYYLE